MFNFTRIVFLICIFQFSSYLFALERALNDDEILITTDMSSADVQLEIDEADDNAIILFDIGEYSLNISVSSLMTLKGIDTENVKLSSLDGTAIISALNKGNVTIQNLSFDDSALAIKSEGSNVTIQNNIFTVGVGNTAIELDNLSTIEITNNTFHTIGEAVSVTDNESSPIIKNNIFAEFDSPDTLFNLVINSNLANNCFDQAVSNYSDLGASQVSSDLGFASSQPLEDYDFHLNVDSDCKDRGENNSDLDGTQTDIGAFGGQQTDIYPQAVKNITDPDIINDDGSLASVQIGWDLSNDYRVGGYKIYYDTEKMFGANPYRDRTLLDFDSVNADTSTKLIENLTSDISQLPTPDAPTLLTVLPEDKKLKITWTKKDNAVSYTLHYRAGDNGVEQNVALGNVSEYELTGLSNGQEYFVWLTALNKLQYHFQVIPYLSINQETNQSEALFSSEDITLDIGSVESSASSTLSATPEAIVAYPQLPNEGCFIATAAFGFYSHSQVQVLRDFRDDYLLTHPLGRSFVTWYYDKGPIAAEFIREHDYLKPLVRVLLFPLILLAKFLSLNMMIWLGIGCFGGLIYYYKRKRWSKKYSSKGLSEC